MAGGADDVGHHTGPGHHGYGLHRDGGGTFQKAGAAATKAAACWGNPTTGTRSLPGKAWPPTPGHPRPVPAEAPPLPASPLSPPRSQRTAIWDYETWTAGLRSHGQWSYGPVKCHTSCRSIRRPDLIRPTIYWMRVRSIFPTRGSALISSPLPLHSSSRQRGNPLKKLLRCHSYADERDSSCYVGVSDAGCQSHNRILTPVHRGQ